MNLHISGHHVDITPALNDFVTEKLRKVARHVDSLIDADVVLTVDGPRHASPRGVVRHKAEARLHLAGGSLFAEAVAEDMYAAIDALIGKLDRQATRFNGKRHNHHPQEARRLLASSAG